MYIVRLYLFNIYFQCRTNQKRLFFEIRSKLLRTLGAGSTSRRLAPNSSKRGLTMKCTTWKGSRKYSVHDFQKCASTKENFSVVNWRTSQWLLNPSWRNEAGLFAVHLDMKYDSSPLERGIRSYDILFDPRKYF